MSSLSQQISPLDTKVTAIIRSIFKSNYEWKMFQHSASFLEMEALEMGHGWGAWFWTVQERSPVRLLFLVFLCSPDIAAYQQTAPCWTWFVSLREIYPRDCKRSHRLEQAWMGMSWSMAVYMVPSQHSPQRIAYNLVDKLRCPLFWYFTEQKQHAKTTISVPISQNCQCQTSACLACSSSSTGR